MKKSPYLNNLISYLGQIILFFLFRTSTWKINGIENLNMALKRKKPIMLCVWHGRFLFPAFWLAKNNIHAYAIASHHGDAAIIASIFKRWGFSLIRGSSNKKGKDKGGSNVIKEMNKIFDIPKNNIIAITNDGPKGPIRIAKPGSLSIALKKDVQIITMTGTASKYIEFKSWDRFRIPKPFSKIYLNIAPVLDIPLQKLILEDEIEYLTNYMNKYQDEIDNIAGNK